MELAISRAPLRSITNLPRLSSPRIAADGPFRLLSSSSSSSSRKCKLSFPQKLTGARRINCSLVEVEGSLEDEACELVHGNELSIGEGDDTVNAYLCQAVKNNNGTGILLLSDVFGFEDSATRDFAYRVACNGYNVLVPDLFSGDPWAKSRSQAMFKQWLVKHDAEKVVKRVDLSTEWLINEFVAVGLSKKLGVVGFCFGGGKMIDVLARDQAGRFGAGVSFYGTRVDPSLARDVKVPVLFVTGDEDPLCSVGSVESAAAAIGQGSRAEIFLGREHGFVHRPRSPEEDGDAERAFLLTRNWLHDRLIAKND